VLLNEVRLLKWCQVVTFKTSVGIAAAARCHHLSAAFCPIPFFLWTADLVLAKALDSSPGTMCSVLTKENECIYGSKHSCA
jgi:hypothetical protein